MKKYIIGFMACVFVAICLGAARHRHYEIVASSIPDFNEAVYSEPNVVKAYDHSQATTNVHGLTFTSEGTGGGLDADTVNAHSFLMQPRLWQER